MKRAFNFSLTYFFLNSILILYYVKNKLIKLIKHKGGLFMRSEPDSSDYCLNSKKIENSFNISLASECLFNFNFPL